MSIIIDKKRCTGCKRCTAVCPGNLIKCGEDGRPFIKYPKDCWGCSSCLKECAQSAICLYLGSDIGGRGSKLSVKIEGDIVRWKVEKGNGDVYNIDINRKDSNKY